MAQVPFAITNQPWLVKHIMSYHWKTYQKQDKAQHKILQSQVNNELLKYHYIVLQFHKYDYTNKVKKIKTLGRRSEFNNTYPQFYNFEDLYIDSYDMAMDTFKENKEEYIEAYDGPVKFKFPGIGSDQIPVVKQSAPVIN